MSPKVRATGSGTYSKLPAGEDAPKNAAPSIMPMPGGGRGNEVAAPDGAIRRTVLKRHHEELESRIAQAQAHKELVEHTLHCSVDDFIDCPNSQSLAERLDERFPLRAATGDDG